MSLLALDRHDFEVAVAIINKADRLAAERRKQNLDYLIDGIGHKVAESIGKIFG